jgi:N-acetylglucosamine kinase-like BadF-type ATPase
MILVADSGSSKTDWILQLPDSKSLEFRTKGLNPFYLNEKEIVKILNNTEAIIQNSSLITEVYFFGAGCSSPDRREVVSNALSSVFKNAFVNVEHDMLGSAYATCGKSKGITCILGTGSNIAFYDGEEVSFGKHGLGFILGDEGSGTYFGKKLLTSFLYGIMPPDLRKKFKDKYKIGKEIVLTEIYQKPDPNIYLASFARFMSEYKSHLFIKNLLAEGFREYIQSNIISFPESKMYPCHFVGSIAFHFQDILVEMCRENKIVAGRILAQPIHGLYNFIISR